MPSRQVRLDAAVVLLLTGVMAAELAISDKPGATLSVPAVLLVALASLPVVLRHTHPVASVIACMAMLFVVIPFTAVYQTVPLPAMVAVYALVVRADRRRTVWAGLLLAPLALLSLHLYSPHGLLDWGTPKNLGLVALPLVLGSAVRERRAHTAALVDRARVAEQTREEETRRRVGEERLRIARDVHDVVAHAMVAINVQAGVGAHLMCKDPDRARASLVDIKRVSGEALDDLRSTLGVLRDNGDDDAAPVRPALSLRELDELGATLRASGVEVDVDVGPSAQGLPAAVDVTGYRIIQEALTNVLRHGNTDRAAIRVRREGALVVIDIENDAASRDPRHGPTASAATSGSGNGLRGMRERAQAAGGTLEAGRGANGGWRVRASLPLPAGL